MMQMDINDSSFEQRYAMAVLYFSLNGEDWGATNWLSGASECYWDFVFEGQMTYYLIYKR